MEEKRQGPPKRALMSVLIGSGRMLGGGSNRFYKNRSKWREEKKKKQTKIITTLSMVVDLRQGALYDVHTLTCNFIKFYTGRCSFFFFLAFLLVFFFLVCCKILFTIFGGGR